MAYDFKTIGTTAAKVVSLLAVAGGVYWWQRPATPVDIPRPQDEAVIMHATLERHYAMGRTDTSFLKTYAANISKIAWGVQTNEIVTTPMTNVVITYTNGTQEVLTGTPDPAGSTTTWKSGYWTWSTQAGMGDGYIQYIVDFDQVRWIGYPKPPCTLNAYLGFTPLPELGQLYAAPTNAVPFTNYTYETAYTYVTNSLAHVDTNTIGFFPNAAFQYPSLVRSALDYQRIGSDQYNYGTVQWVFPSNSYLTSGSWSGTFSDIPATFLSIDSAWWTNYVTLSTAHWLTTSNFFISTNVPPVVTLLTNWWVAVVNFWDPGYPGYQTNNAIPPCTFMSQIYTNEAQVNCWNGSPATWVDQPDWQLPGYPGWYAYDPYYIPAKAFSFERDKKEFYWSTNAYDDLARALSLMQWQKMTKVGAWAVQNGYVTVVSTSTQSMPDVWLWGGFYCPPDGYYCTSDNCTSVPVTTNFWTNANVGVNIPWSGVFLSVPSEIGQFTAEYDLWELSDGGSPPHVTGHGVYMSVAYTPAMVRVTNTTAFTFTNGSFWGYGPTNDVQLRLVEQFPVPKVVSDPTNLLPHVAPGVDIPASTNVQLSQNGWVLLPGKSTNSVAFPVVDTIAVSAACAGFFNDVLVPLVDSLGTSNQYYYDYALINYNGDAVTYGVDSHGRPLYPHTNKTAASYQVIFESLTNYLNHAPTR